MGVCAQQAHRLGDIYIDQKHIHAIIAEDPQQLAFGVLGYDLGKLRFAQPRCLRNTGNLDLCRLRGNMGIQARPGGRQQVGRDILAPDVWVFLQEGGDILLDPGGQLREMCIRDR